MNWQKSILLSIISLLQLHLAPLMAKNNYWHNIALEKKYIYRVYIRDKSNSPYSLDNPKGFLSDRAIERRKKQNIELDSTDLPVSPNYVAALREKGFTIMGTSRWHNTVTIASDNQNAINGLKTFSFVRDCLRLYVSPDSIMVAPKVKVEKLTQTDSISKSEYGDGLRQISLMNGVGLHKAGFKGKGMLIAIMDAGFCNANTIPVLKDVKIDYAADFAPRRTKDIYSEHYHGTMVLSTMAANKPNIFIGTAPEAHFALIRTEDIDTETRAEEDSWTMGAEYADSIGADLINSSLGYTRWDGDTIGIELRNLDGNTTYISQTAAMLSSKGIVLCNSAGNEGNSSWHKINVPADAKNILAVGAVDFNKMSANFSSVGPSQDARIKPDICGPGKEITVIDANGKLRTNNGTSFASPIICGLVACLWQALPQLNARQILEITRKSADRGLFPDNVYGYGIPDFMKAMEIGKHITQ